MADETKPAVSNEDIKSLRTVFIGSNLIFWIVAVAMILYLQKISDKLEKLNTAMTGLQAVASNANLESFQVVEGDWSQHYMKPDQAEPVVKFSFRRVEPQMPEDGMVPGPDGMAPPVAPAPVAPAPKSE
jgi:hypothetical protein